jgi:hypothetical protein
VRRRIAVSQNKTLSHAEGESARALARGTNNLQAYLKLLQAYEQRMVYNKDSIARTRQLAEGYHTESNIEKGVFPFEVIDTTHLIPVVTTFR